MSGFGDKMRVSAKMEYQAFKHYGDGHEILTPIVQFTMRQDSDISNTTPAVMSASYVTVTLQAPTKITDFQDFMLAAVDRGTNVAFATPQLQGFSEVAEAEDGDEMDEGSTGQEIA
jgi:hypothetical protein